MPSPTATRTCRLVTLGCKVNQYETQHVKETLEANGYREARPDEPAHLCVVNTCTVTHEADAKARQLIRQLNRSNPGAALVVMGCYATRDPEAVARLPGVVKVITDKRRLVEELREFGVTRAVRGISRFDGHQRAFVKVQDGCLLNCTFCIIPSVRPGLRSRPAAEIEEEVRRLVDAGTQEIVLTGIHLGHYGIDLSRGKPKQEWTRLWHLLDRLGRLPGAFRIRLSSLEAAEARDDLIRAIAGNPRVVPHLHLCLQSGSDRVLARMRRRYRVASFLERCRQLRRALDLPALTTDLIVGFPGETEEDFEATCRVARAAEFAAMHIFPFSPRRGTVAATLPDQVPPPVVAARKARLAALAEELTQAYLRQLVGRRLDVLVEGVLPDRPGHVTGTSCRRVPVVFPGSPALVRRRVAVRATAVVGATLAGETADPPAGDKFPLPVLPQPLQGDFC
jgi:threonylcarbamoyladenosine tRNA methylthiotransferase MtaB